MYIILAYAYASGEAATVVSAIAGLPSIAVDLPQHDFILKRVNSTQAPRRREFAHPHDLCLCNLTMAASRSNSSRVSTIGVRVEAFIHAHEYNRWDVHSMMQLCWIVLVKRSHH